MASIKKLLCEAEMVLYVVLLTALVLVSGSVKAQTWEDPCGESGDMSGIIFPCMYFLQGFEPTPSWDCCNQLEDLNEIAKQEEGQQKICQCIEYLATLQGQGELGPSGITDFSGNCTVNPTFPVSNGLNCSIINSED